MLVRQAHRVRTVVCRDRHHMSMQRAQQLAQPLMYQRMIVDNENFHGPLPISSVCAVMTRTAPTIRLWSVARSTDAILHSGRITYYGRFGKSPYAFRLRRAAATA